MYHPHILLLRAYVHARKYTGANATNHRPEQSALSLLFWKINFGGRAGSTATKKLEFFSKMDKDRSGGLDAEEVRIEYRLDGKYLNDTELNNLFHALDSSQDGFLDFQELDRNGNGMQGASSGRELGRHLFYETSVRQPRVQSVVPKRLHPCTFRAWYLLTACARSRLRQERENK